MSRPLTKIFAPLAIFALIAGFWMVQRGRPKVQRVITQTSEHQRTGTPVNVVSPIMKTVDDVLHVTGQLAAESTVSLSSKVQGKVVSVFGREGDSVSAGQVVIQLDDSDARRQMEQAESGVEQATAQLKVANARLSQATTGLSVGDSQSESTYETAKAGLQAAKARYQMVTTGARRQERLQAQNAVAMAAASLEKAQSDYRRYKGLFEQGAISAATLDAFRTAYDVAKSQHDNAVQAASLVDEGARTEDVRQAEAGVRQAEEALRAATAARKTSAVRRDDVTAAKAGVSTAQAGVSAARAALGIARQNVDNFRIRSPRAGSITMRGVEPGQYVNPGQSLLTVVDLKTIFLRADVSEVDVQRVRPGMTAKISVDALRPREWTGRIVSIVASADPASRSFTARVAVANPGFTLKPNMFARADIVLGREASALVLPKECVISRDNRDVVVRVVNGKVNIVPVQRGVASSDGVVVRSSVLTTEDKIISGGQQSLTDGNKVYVAEG